MCQYSDTWLGFLQLICHLWGLKPTACRTFLHLSVCPQFPSMPSVLMEVNEGERSVLGFHTWWSQRTTAALQQRTSMRADALNTSDLRPSLRKPTMAVSSNYTCSTSAGREELRLTALCTGQYCRGQRSFKNIFELKSMEVTEERRDTAERIQNIWCFLMTVKVSSYQKVSQRSLHVLSVLHH